MKIYTKSGDEGTTGLLGSGRVAKDHPRIEAYGAVDELNAALGAARAAGIDPKLESTLARVQDELFAVGAALADPDPNGKFHGMIVPDHVARLEREIDAMESGLPALNQFILPGGSPGAAQLHLARAICRRAERRVVHLSHQEGEDVPAPLIIYLNRLSDFLFVASRLANRQAEVEDIPWSGL